MKLVQILLPVRDNHGRWFKRAIFEEVHEELVKRFGGLTAYSRSPARGLWKSGVSTQLDDIVVLEVMTARISLAWWKNYRRTLERTFRQDQIVLRIQDIMVV
jgi:hypothetical protein